MSGWLSAAAFVAVMLLLTLLYRVREGRIEGERLEYLARHGGWWPPPPEPWPPPPEKAS